jgi:hypothetical protein
MLKRIDFSGLLFVAGIVLAGFALSYGWTEAGLDVAVLLTVAAVTFFERRFVRMEA